jgi:hypothetical protein
MEDSQVVELLQLERYPFQYNGMSAIPTLQTITTGTSTDSQALAQVLAYYENHRDELAEEFGESHSHRLAALFIMYVVHISHNYGERIAPASLLDYLSGGNSHCGMYSRFQAQILDAMGMEWRIFWHDGAEHAWVEVNIDGQWEIFDATTNIWINTDGYSLIAGQPREARLFYSPMNDVTRPEARAHFLEGYNMPLLRWRMPQLGLRYTPEVSTATGFLASVIGEGSTYHTPWYIWHDTQQQ